LNTCAQDVESVLILGCLGTSLDFFVLGVILPWRGSRALEEVMAMPQVGTMERLVLYASTIGFQWLAAAVVAWRAWAHGYTAEQLG